MNKKILKWGKWALFLWTYVNMHKAFESVTDVVYIAYIALLIIIVIIGHVLTMMQNCNLDKKILLFAIGYFTYNLIFLYILYPGVWVGDEIDIYNLAVQGELHYWQGYLTSIMYMWGLMLWPSPIGVVLFQVIIATIIVTYFFSQVQVICKCNGCKYLIMTVFFVPLVVNYNLYPLRMSLYALLEILLMFLVIKEEYEKRNGQRRITYLLYIFLVSILSVWRSEGILYIPLFLIFILFHVKGWWRKKITLLFLCVVSTILLILPTYNTSSSLRYRYQLSGIISSLGPIVHACYEDENQVLLKQFSTIINVEKVEESYLKGVKADDQYTLDYNKEITRDEMSDFKWGYIKAVLRYPKVFISNRFSLFKEAITNGWRSSTGSLYSSENSRNILFVKTSVKNNPIDYELRRRVGDWIVGYGVHSTISKGMFNMLPQLFAYAIMVLMLVIKKKWWYVYILCMMAVRMGLVFLTAPAPYFMYYYTLWIAGSIILILEVFWLFEEMHKRIPIFRGYSI